MQKSLSCKSEKRLWKVVVEFGHTQYYLHYPEGMTLFRIQMLFQSLNRDRRFLTAILRDLRDVFDIVALMSSLALIPYFVFSSESQSTKPRSPSVWSNGVFLITIYHLKNPTVPLDQRDGKSPKFKEDLFILSSLANSPASIGECTRCEFSSPHF